MIGERGMVRSGQVLHVGFYKGLRSGSLNTIWIPSLKLIMAMPDAVCCMLWITPVNMTIISSSVADCISSSIKAYCGLGGIFFRKLMT